LLPAIVKVASPDTEFFDLKVPFIVYLVLPFLPAVKVPDDEIGASSSMEHPVA
jgi:hypothetical protein